MESIQGNITFVFDVLSENVVNFVSIWLFLQMKNVVNLDNFFSFDNEATVRKSFTLHISGTQFNTLAY